MRKLITSALATLVMLTGITLGAAEPAEAKAQSYRGQVVAGTWKYGPCVKLRKSSAGRAAYWDMVSDTYDDGRKRSVKAQISYVRQGCRNGS